MSGVSHFSGRWRGASANPGADAPARPAAQYFDPVRAAAAPATAPSVDRSLNERLSQLFNDESVERLSVRVAEFRRSLEQTLEKSSQAYQLLMQLEETNLKDCARCTKELQTRLAGNPHFLVLGKLREAEDILSRMEFTQR